jgi:hypothetical protein
MTHHYHQLVQKYPLQLTQLAGFAYFSCCTLHYLSKSKPKKQFFQDTNTTKGCSKSWWYLKLDTKASTKFPFKCLFFLKNQQVIVLEIVNFQDNKAMVFE